MYAGPANVLRRCRRVGGMVLLICGILVIDAIDAMVPQGVRKTKFGRWLLANGSKPILS